MKWVQKGVPKGLQIDHRGYARITKGGRLKWKYLHRYIIERLLEETHPLTLASMGIQLRSNGKMGDLSGKWDVHHINQDKLDCRPANLMLLEKVWHGRAFVNSKNQIRPDRSTIMGLKR